MAVPTRLVLPAEGIVQPGALLEGHYRSMVETCGTATALWTSDGEVSQEEFQQRISALLAAVRSRASLLRHECACGVLCGDTIENMVLALALSFAGIPQVLLPCHAPVAELEQIIRRCRVDVIVADRSPPSALGLHRLARLGQGMELWAAPTWTDGPPPDVVPPGDLPSLLARTGFLGLTSGTTTGIPSVTRSSWHECLAALQQPAWPPVNRMLMNFGLQFGASRGWAMRVLLEGTTLCVVHEWERPRIHELAGASGADGLGVGPAGIQLLLEQEQDRPFPAELRFMTGSDRMPASLRRRFLERFGPRLWVLYASSQSGPLTRLEPERLLEHDGESIGRPLPDVSFSLDPASIGSSGDPNVGEVVVRKVWTVRLEDPRAGPIDIEHPLEEFRPSDLLRAWPDGSYSFAGRANDVFLFRSVLVSPHEIEDLLAEEPSVQDVVAFGAPSTSYGAVPMAVVTLRTGIDPDRELPRLRRLCQERMGFRAPHAVMAVEEIPRGASGKALRRVLAERYALS